MKTMMLCRKKPKAPVETNNLSLGACGLAVQSGLIGAVSSIMSENRASPELRENCASVVDARLGAEADLSRAGRERAHHPRA